MKADMKGLNQLEAAILMEELNVINGMLHYGSPEEKARAKKLFKEKYEPLVLSHVNYDAIKIAQRELGFSDDELNIYTTNGF